MNKTSSFLAGAIVALSLPIMAQAAPDLPVTQDSPNGATSPSVKATRYYPCTPQKYTKRMHYPQAKRINHTDNYHGVKVADPYRWLEDIDSRYTKSWVAKEVQLTKNYFAHNVYRPIIRARLNEYQNYPRYGCPSKKGGRYFYRFNPGLNNHAALYMTDSLEQPGRIILDPNTFSADGTKAMSFSSVSPNGKYLAYGVSDGGSDWNTIHILDIDNQQTLSDQIEWVKFSYASWDKNGQGFYYSRFPASKSGLKDRKAVNTNHTLYYHKLGTPQSSDLKVLDFPDHPNWTVDGRVSKDGKWLMVTIERLDEECYSIMLKSLQTPDSAFIELPHSPKTKSVPIDVINDQAFVMTNHKAPNYCLVSFDLAKPEAMKPKVIIAESKNSLETVTRVGSHFFAQYLKDAHSFVLDYDLQGHLVRELSVPGIGTLAGLGGDQDSTETFYLFTSYTCPTSVYSYDLATGKSTLWKKPQLKVDTEQYKTEQVFVTSKDGTKVPMFLSYRRDLKLNGNLPVLMYGYGGFSISLTPQYSNTCAAWMDMGGVYAVVNLRGGSEYGEAWHEGGIKLKKQNVFDDFIAAGEWLIANSYTNPQRLAIMGGSNGGLLVGACLNQRPDLFGAAVASVGVMDMLRFSKFTIGYAWESDYGSVDKLDEFKALYAYSPYHNIKEYEYPATLITTADHDDRVYPAHSFKYAAALQHAQQGPAPILIRISTRAGHGGGKPTSMYLDESADYLSFLAEAMHMDVPTSMDMSTSK